MGGDGDTSGWIARYSHGVTQRANSVYPAGPVMRAQETVSEVERWYAERGLPALFQLADDDEELLTMLLARRYQARNETLVLAAEASAVAGALTAAQDRDSGGGRPDSVSAVVRETPDEEWLDLWWSVDGRGGEAELEVASRILTGGPALYATVRDDRGTASVGRLALVEQNGVTWGGLYTLATRADVRGRGHARAVIASLLGHGAERGVTAVWLQVLSSNVVATRLYDRLGFRPAATYRYLIGPTD